MVLQLTLLTSALLPISVVLKLDAGCFEHVAALREQCFKWQTFLALKCIVKEY